MWRIHPEERADFICYLHRRINLQASQSLHVENPIVELTRCVLVTMNAFSFAKELLFHKGSPFRRAARTRKTLSTKIQRRGFEMLSGEVLSQGKAATDAIVNNRSPFAEMMPFTPRWSQHVFASLMIVFPRQGFSGSFGHLPGSIMCPRLARRSHFMAPRTAIVQNFDTLFNARIDPVSVKTVLCQKQFGIAVSH